MKISNNFFTNKKILVIGGTGSIGKKLLEHLISSPIQPDEIRILSRGESRQVAMKEDFSSHPNLTFYIGDIRDRTRTIEAMKGIDIVFNMAALKHVSICEENPTEAVKTNVDGVKNIILAAQKNNVATVIHCSSIKAIKPTSVYGRTKAAGEILLKRANTTGATRFIAVRFGNVLGSDGSVLPLFIQQVQKHNQLVVTNKNMSRFIMTFQQAVDLLLDAAKPEQSEDILSRNMPVISISDLAQVIKEKLGNRKTSIEIASPRPGESLYTSFESKNSTFTSADVPKMNQQDIVQLLSQEGYL